jgi:hypothetical protein
MPNLEMAKMPDDLDVQALSHYASIQTGTEEIIAAFPEKQEHQNFFDSFATVRKVRASNGHHCSVLTSILGYSRAYLETR